MSIYTLLLVLSNLLLTHVDEPLFYHVNGIKSVLYKFKVFNIIRLMKNSTLGMLIVIAGVLTIFVKHEYAWIVSAILIGGGTGLFFWKDKE